MLRVIEAVVEVTVDDEDWHEAGENELAAVEGALGTSGVKVIQAEPAMYYNASPESTAP